MKNNGAKNYNLKLNSRGNHIKVKKNNSNNNASIKNYNKSNKNKEPSFITNSEFLSVIDLIPKNFSNKIAYNTIIKDKKSSLNIKNKNKINDFQKMNYKYYTNRQNFNANNLKENKKLNILKDKSKENISNNLPKDSKDIKQSYNYNKIHTNKLNNNAKIININLLTEKVNNSYEKVKQLIEISSLLDDKNKKSKNNKKIKLNKNNLKSYEQIKNQIYSSPLNLKEITNLPNKILPIKKHNSTINSNIEINNNTGTNNNTFYSCYNFYQKENAPNNNMNKTKYNYNKMLNTINNFQFHNNSNIFKKEENVNMNHKNKNKTDILFDKENFSLNIGKPNLIINLKNTIKNTDYKRFSKIGIYNKNDINKNNKDKKILNKIINRDRDKNKLIEYKKKLINYFCKSVEDYIYISVKKIFDYFIKNLKKFSLQKNEHYLLLKRLQNKVIQKNFYKDKEKTYFFNYLSQNENKKKANCSSIIKMKNNYIMNNPQTGVDVHNGFSREYIGKRKIYNLNNAQSPSLTINYDLNHDYFERMGYRNSLTPDTNNKENVNYLNGNNKINFNNTIIYDSKMNNLINKTINLDFEQEDKRSEKNLQNNISNNLYIPKKFKLTNNSKSKQIDIFEKNDKKENNSYILAQYMNFPKSHNIFSKKSEQNKKFNQSHILAHNPIKSKIGIKKYSSNDNLKNIYNIGCNNHNPNYNIFKENSPEIFSNSIDKIINRNNRIISGEKFDTDINERNSIYKKKLNIRITPKMYSKPKPLKIKNQILDINLHLNKNINESIGQYLSPNLEKKFNNDIVINPKTELITKVNYIPLNIYNYHNIKMPQTEQRREIYLNLNQPNKFGNIQELTVNLTNNNNKKNVKKVTNQTNENIFIYSKNDFDNCSIKESNNNKNYNVLKDEKNIKNEGNEENEDELKEILIKDVSSTDKKLNVFIKYIEMPNINKFIRKNIFDDCNILKYFHVDSFSIPALYQKTMMSNIYYKNYCYGIKQNNNNKIKFDKILSSIMEEEEKSKAAGSINNSLISDEDIGKSINNFSHYFIQSIKYFSNLLQSIFDDKKKDSFHKFFKALKKIKNEMFLQGLINEKKSTLSQSKNKEKNDEKEIS